MLKMLPSRPNALNITAEDVLIICSSSPEFFEFSGLKFYSESFQSVFLQPDHVPEKPELKLSFKFAIVIISWPFEQTFSKQPHPEL